jgi:hypothetical protein
MLVDLLRDLFAWYIITEVILCGVVPFCEKDLKVILIIFGFFIFYTSQYFIFYFIIELFLVLFIFLEFNVL